MSNADPHAVEYSPTIDPAAIPELVARERQRLLAEAGLADDGGRHYRRACERRLECHERRRVTLLFGGLTSYHDRLIQAVGHSLGYQADVLPTPSRDDYHTGREFGNTGMCNPTYFTAGALINYLKRLRDDQGLPVNEILDRYVFVTPGSCGPCRFGMYESEYRMALRNSGFDGFRVLVFQQRKLGQSQKDGGFVVDSDVYVPGFLAMMIADVLTALANQIRPYEVEPGQTDRVFGRILDRVCEHIRNRDTSGGRPTLTARALRGLLPGLSLRQCQLLVSHIRLDEYAPLLRECAEEIEREIEVDFLRVKPVCKIVGEFWAQTTDGDGNFRMFRFLEQQGAEVWTEPVTTWFMYLVSQARMRMAEQQRALWGQGNRMTRARRWMGYQLRQVQLALAYRVIGSVYDRVRLALGGTTHGQADQRELRQLAAPYYNPSCEGGEGHLEVAKSIYYTREGLAHMILSLKPFGCMPSTQSDGAQAAVCAHYPDILFLPVETSGDGAINAYSRVQMTLGDAKYRCKEEFAACLARTGRTLGEIRDYVRKHPHLRRPLQHIPHYDKTAGRAANFVLHVARLMNEGA